MKKILLSSVIFILLDQIVKFLITIYMNLNESVAIIKSFFDLSYVHNTGAAFSILSGSRLLLVLLTLLALIFIILFLIPKKNIKKKDVIIYGMLLGGITGNLIDRIFRGYVIDYPVFNLADTFIVVSVILIVIFEIKENINGRNSSK